MLKIFFATLSLMKFFVTSGYAHYEKKIREIIFSIIIFSEIIFVGRFILEFSETYADHRVSFKSEIFFLRNVLSKKVPNT